MLTRFFFPARGHRLLAICSPSYHQSPLLPSTAFSGFQISHTRLTTHNARNMSSAPSPNPNKVMMYGANWCPDCVRAKQLLDRLKVPYEYITKGDGRSEAKAIAGRANIPVLQVR